MTAQSKGERSDLEVTTIRHQLREIKADAERRVQDLERRNLDLES